MKVSYAVIAICLNSISLADEVTERATVQNLATTAYQDFNFAELERQAAEYRTEASKTSSGTWKLPFFYRGISLSGLNFEKGENAAWTEAIKGFDQWISMYPNSPTPYVARAEAFLQRGLKYRGQGWASQVLDDDKQPYAEMVVEAAKFSIENEAIASNDPHWYRVVADALRHLGADREYFLELVNRGLDKYPNYDELYFVPAGYLSPKWGGSREDLEAFARSAVQRTKATRGNEMYARIYWAAGQGADGRYMMQTLPASWERFLAGADEILETYPSQWNINWFAYFACFKTDEKAANKYLEMIEEPIVMDAWHVESNYELCKQHVAHPEILRGVQQ